GWEASRGSAFSVYAAAEKHSEIDVWHRAIVPPGPAWEPSLYDNGTDRTIAPFGSNPMPPGALSVHPGPKGENSVVRWTAPLDGSYQVAATFSGLDNVGPTTTDVAVLRGTSQLFSGDVSGYQTGPTFTTGLQLTAGETLDFTVGLGKDGGYGNDMTRLELTITGSPGVLPLGSLPAATAGVAYDETIDVTGGTAPYTFSLTSGSLPAGLTLSTAGRLHGTPATAGTSTFTAQAGDASTPAKEGARTYSLRVAPASGELVENGDFEAPAVSGNWATFFAPATFGGWHVDSGSIDLVRHYWPAATGAQSVDVAGLGGPGLISQTLPTVPGTTYELSFNFAGNPDFNGDREPVKRMEVFWGGESLGVFEFDTTGHSLGDLGWARITRSVTAKSDSTTLEFVSRNIRGCGPTLDTVSVIPGGGLVLGSLPSAPFGKPYDQTISVTGGTGPYSFSLKSGSLPDGLSLSSSGALSGTPTEVGTSGFTIEATDSSSPTKTGERTYSLTVVAPFASIVVSAPSSVVKGAVFTVTATAKDADGNRVTDYSGPASWSDLSGALSPAAPAAF